jgi:hypothetical protein
MLNVLSIIICLFAFQPVTGLIGGGADLKSCRNKCDDSFTKCKLEASKCNQVQSKCHRDCYCDDKDDIDLFLSSECNSDGTAKD